MPNLKIHAPTQCFVDLDSFWRDCEMHPNLMQKSMDFEVENREKVIKKGFKNMTFFLHGFCTNFGPIWEGLGGVLGSILASKTGPQRAKLYFSVKM